MVEPIRTTMRIIRVNQILLRISLILNALMSVLNILDHLCLTAECLDLLLGRCRECIHLDIELLGELTSTQDLDAVKFLLDDTGLLKEGNSYKGIVVKHLESGYKIGRAHV